MLILRNDDGFICCLLLFVFFLSDVINVLVFVFLGLSVSVFLIL